ncbi:hypothetical protein [uncultured Christiangramia sp.]|uniref:hypothetical protein n=1 Tax=Christiangramia sp. 3-2217-3z TaxID=3417564 RepID=UPI0026279416|nr:hypothetical protein [uncultured Christiangramia sp.]
MKTLIPNILEGMMCVIGAISTRNNSFFSRNSFINEDFVDQFNSDEDRKLLSQTVNDLKLSNEKSRKIKLSNDKIVTIVID